ncbi:oligosaccharide flippase family protein [Rhodovulum sp. P5]|nr:oligosaccharide flippase family protein [Rhodovulum sp. P5]
MSAGGWHLAMTIVQRLFSLISNLIMTRLLMPEAFGMLALAAAVMTAVTLFTDIGINRSIMREIDGADDRFLRVAWVVKVLRGIVIGAGILAAGIGLWLLPEGLFPPDSVYAQPEMPGVIAMIAISPILDGLASTSRELVMRRLENRRLVLLRIVAQLCVIPTMIGAAQISPTVWALMAGMLLGNLLNCVFTHLFLPGPRMRFEWDGEIAARLWQFGKWLLLSSALTFVALNADKLILGGLLEATLFGIYVIAQIWVESGRVLLNQLNSYVTFPVVAEVMRSRPDEVARLYRKVQTAVDFFCFSGFLVAFLLGPWLIDTLYTEEYHEAGRYLQLLSPVFLIMRYDSLGNLVLNSGDSRAVMLISAQRAAAICVFLPLGYRFFGIEGAILAAVTSPGLAVPYILSKTRHILGQRQTVFDAAIFGLSLVALGAIFALL